MPALEALLNRFQGAHTQVLGVSVDSMHCHANFAQSLGGISFPLLADFHPKGAVGSAYGVYVEAAGLDARATVLIDAAGVVQFAEMADGQRDMSALAERCEKLDADFGQTLPEAPEAPGISRDVTLFVKSRCGFSTATLVARTNLHLEDALPVVNVSEDEAALEQLRKISGDTVAPCLVQDGEPMRESKEIIAALVAATAPIQN